jgi:hypothetical protein
MSNVLSEEKKQPVIALGKLGWPLRRIEQATGVRRETASAYLKAAGVVVRLPRFWGKRIPAKPANEVTPDSCGSKPANEVTPDFNAAFSPKPAIRSACEPYRELIEQGLALGRNSKAMWQDLVSEHGFAGSYQTVKRFVRKLRGRESGKQRASSSRHREKKPKSITAAARWCVIRRATSTAGRGCSC